MNLVGYVARTGEMRNPYNILGGKPEAKRPLGRTRRRREDNIRTVLWEVWWEDVDWMHLPVLNTVINFGFCNWQEHFLAG
jgi:hypothetical protein